MISVVIETWNVAGDPRALPRLVAALAAQLGTAELVITDAGLPGSMRHELDAQRAIRWVEVASDAGYYEHKNRGFDASAGDIVAFIDGDCQPAPGWLAAIAAPIARGEALVVAGATSYRGALARLATQLDFPFFAGDRAAGTVRNFFANNVAFAREVFAARRFPTIAPMHHGQCQVLALQLGAADIAIQLAPEARVIHAWPSGAREWLAVRLLRGADIASLVPFVVAHHAPAASPSVAKLGRLPALAILVLRAVAGAWTALREGPLVRGLALVGAVTLVDAIGAAAAPAVYRAIAR